MASATIMGSSPVYWRERVPRTLRRVTPRQAKGDTSTASAHHAIVRRGLARQHAIHLCAHRIGHGINTLRWRHCGRFGIARAIAAVIRRRAARQHDQCGQHVAHPDFHSVEPQKSLPAPNTNARRNSTATAPTTGRTALEAFCSDDKPIRTEDGYILRDDVIKSALNRSAPG